MKSGHLLNRHLSALVASLGHMDEIVVADAGLPVPDGVMVIDLAVSPGIPTVMDVLAALRTELVIEAAVHASEASASLQKQLCEFAIDWGAEHSKDTVITGLPHVDFKTRTGQAKAIIRTGDCTPYNNLILVSGVPF
ncbi:D-ribose pyranase [Pacificibacter marinus]|uniref:D-ribose pyranase n=1 Tax=Pacificibacter marinus TaxID=658057 RepID=UPI001C07AFE9|nr:D-ribose pyranase [Pacificibacter marinus]MBU2867394.1 D-ribose pyranase [Pacificibacter marinus]